MFYKNKRSWISFTGVYWYQWIHVKNIYLFFLALFFENIKKNNNKKKRFKIISGKELIFICFMKLTMAHLDTLIDMVTFYF